jgi:hypothetical protein
LVVVLAAGAAHRVDAQRGHGTADAQVALRADLNRMEGAAAVRVPLAQATSDAQRIAAGYRAMGPLAAGFGPGDYAVNQQMARQSLAWLGRTGVWYMNDAVAARAYLDAYDAVGRFYRYDWRLYSPAAYVAYAGAARLARRLALATAYDWTASALERYAMAYGALVIADGHYVGRWNAPQDLVPVAAPPAQPAQPLKPVELPRIDISTLTPSDREAWDDVRVRFRTVASQVHITRTRLDELAGTLQQQHLALHPENAATAMKMEGFLEDAAELIQAHEFEQAVDALRRADYERGRLKGVTGQ